MPEREEHRMVSVWVGLDDLGNTVVARLQRWLDHEHVGPLVSDVNRILPMLTLPSPDHVPAHELEIASEAICEAIGELLVGPFAQRALLTGDVGLIVTNVWLVIDSQSSALAILPTWLPRLYERFDLLNVRARIHLLVRHRSWELPDSKQLLVTQRLRAAIDAVGLPGSPWAGFTTILVLTDRSGRGGRTTIESVTASMCSFVDSVVLGGITSNQLARAFATGARSNIDPWHDLPIFGSFASRAMSWDEPEQRRCVYAEHRRARLIEALRVPAPRTFTPSAPSLPLLDGAGMINWPAIRLPQWSPRLWQAPRDAFADADELLNSWIVEAKRWRHDMLVAHEDSRAYLEHQAEATQHEFLTNLDDATRTLLEHQSLQGYFSPMSRLLERASAEVTVTRRGLPAPPRSTDDALFNASDAIPLPNSVMDKADKELIRKLERQINPRLLVIVSTGTFFILWGWTVYGAYLVHSWIPPIPGASSTDGTGTSIEQFKNRLIQIGTERIPSLQDALPSTSQVALWAAAIYGIILSCTIVAIIWRQRVALERAWNIIYRRARSWRDETSQTLAADITHTELRLQYDIVDFVLADLRGRSDRLKALDRQLNQPISEESAPDPAISVRYPKEIPPPPPLSDATVDHIMIQFRKARGEDPAFHKAPESVITELLSIAASVAGDTDEDLRRAIHEDKALLNTVLTMIPPELAVQLPPKDPTAFASEGQTTYYLGSPESTLPDLQRTLQGKAVNLQPILVPDRFYGAVLQSGVNARRIFGHYAELANETVLEPIVVITEPDESDAERQITSTLADLPDISLDEADPEFTMADDAPMDSIPTEGTVDGDPPDTTTLGNDSAEGEPTEPLDAPVDLGEVAGTLDADEIGEARDDALSADEPEVDFGDSSYTVTLITDHEVDHSSSGDDRATDPVESDDPPLLNEPEDVESDEPLNGDTPTVVLNANDHARTETDASATSDLSNSDRFEENSRSDGDTPHPDTAGASPAGAIDDPLAPRILRRSVIPFSRRPPT